MEGLIGRAQRIFRAVKRFCRKILHKRKNVYNRGIYIIIHLSKSIECTRANSNGNYGLWVIMCPRRIPYCNEWPTLLGRLRVWERTGCGGTGMSMRTQFSYESKTAQRHRLLRRKGGEKVVVL